MREHPDVSLDVLDFVSDKVLKALRAASAALDQAGVRHAIIGGLAVGAYGHVRATKDVDFLVGDEAFEFPSGPDGMMFLAKGVPFEFQGIPTDMLGAPKETPGIISDLDEPVNFDGLPLVSPETLVVMKLVAKRRKDREDVKALFALGVVNEARIRRQIGRVARSLEDAKALNVTLDSILQEQRDGE